MDALSLAIGLSLIISGLVMLSLSIAMARGKTRRNPWYGVRLTESMKSDAAWDAINRYGGRQMIGASIVVVLAGVAALLIPLQSRPIWTMVFPGIVLGAVVVAAVRIMVFESDYAKAGKAVAKELMARPIKFCPVDGR